MVNVRIVANDALTSTAADFIAAQAQNAIAERGRFTIALSGGGTPKPVYELMATEPYRTRIDWQRVEVFFGDERCVPPESPDSNWHMARTAFGDRLPIQDTNWHRMRGEDLPDNAASDYEAILASRLGSEGLDLVLLGLGDNGHTASLFPGLAAVTETAKRVMAQYVEVAGMWRLTLTPVAINAARCVLFLVGGANKSVMVARVLEGPPDPVVLPSQAIAPANGELHWLVDTAAGSRLKSGT